MKVKITHPIPGHPDYQVGHTYDLTPKEAKQVISSAFGFEVKEKEEKHGDRQNPS